MLPSKSSTCRNAMILSFFVYLIFLSAIMPPMVADCPSCTAVAPVSSSSRKSTVVLVAFFLHISSYSSRGCPLIYTPKTSFSNPSSISLEYSPISGIFISNSSFCSSETQSKREICPARLFFLSCCIRSIICTYTLINCLRVPPSPSKAPALIKFSTARLLTSLSATRVIKSFKFL